MDTKTCKTNVCPCTSPLEAQRCDRIPLPCDPTRRGARRACPFFCPINACCCIFACLCPSRPEELFCEGIHDRVARPALDLRGTRRQHPTLHKWPMLHRAAEALQARHHRRALGCFVCMLAALHSAPKTSRVARKLKPKSSLQIWFLRTCSWRPVQRIKSPCR